MADKDRAMFINQMNEAMEQVSKSTDAYVEVLGDLKNVTGLTGTALDMYKNKVAQLTKNVVDGNKFSKESLAILKQQKAELRNVAREQEALAAKVKMATFLTDDWGTKLKKTVGVIKEASRFTNEFVGNLTRGSSGKGLSFSLSEVSKELLGVNRAMYESQRQAKMSGNAMVANINNWRDFRGELTMSLQEFKRLQNEMNRLNWGKMFDDNAFRDISIRFQKAFGFDDAVFKDSFRRVMSEGEGMLAGFKDYIEDSIRGGVEGGFSNMGAVAQTMALKGGSVRTIQDFIQLATTPSGKAGNSALLEYERAIKAKNAAIADTYAKMGKNSETALINIEKGITKLVEATDKLVNSMSIIPTIMMSMQALNLGSTIMQFMELAKATKMAATSMQAMRAAQVGGGGGMPINPIFGSKSTGGISGGAMMRGAGIAGGLALGVYGLSNLYGSFNDEAKAKDWAGRREAGKRRTRGNVAAGAGAGMLAGTFAGPLGMLLGAGIGAGVGWGIDKAYGPSSPVSDDMVGYLENLGYTSAFKGQTFSDVEMSGTQALADRLKISQNRRNKMKSRLRSGSFADDGMGGATGRGLATKAVADEEMKIDLLLKGMREVEKLSDGEIRKKLKKSGMNDDEVDALMRGNKERMAATKAEEKANEALKKKMETEYKILALVMQQKKGLSDIAEIYSSMSSRAEGVAGTLDQGGFGGGGIFMKQAAENAAKLVAVRRSLIEQNNKLENNDLFKTMAAQSLGLTKTYSSLTGSDVTGRKLTEIATSGMGREERAAEVAKLVEDKAIRDKILKNMEAMSKEGGDIFNKQVELVKVQEKNRLYWDYVESIQRKVLTNLKEMTYSQKQQSQISEASLGLAKSQTALREATVAGYAMSLQARVKEYKMIGEQISAEKEAQVINEKAEKNAIDNAQKNTEYRKRFARELQMIQSTNDGERLRGMKLLSAKYNALNKGERDQLEETHQSIMMTTKTRIDQETRVNNLLKQQVDMVMQMKEGYLDVINEMTTANDIVSQTIPDAQRGVMALHEMAAGQKGIGGALRRGFVTTDNMGRTDVSNALKWGMSGIEGKITSTGVIEKYMQGLLKNLYSGNAAIIPGGGQSEKTSVYGGEKAGGGPIAGGSGNPTADDILIRVSSGEWVIPANRVKKYRQIIQAIQDGTLDPNALGGFLRNHGSRGWNNAFGQDVIPGVSMHQASPGEAASMQKSKAYDSNYSAALKARLNGMYAGRFDTGHYGESVAGRSYEDIVSERKKRYSAVRGYASGGLVGMRIGSLHLNGKVIGQDISSSPGTDWDVAMQNANG